MAPPRRFRAPTGNGEVLAEPGFDAVPALVEENRRKLDRADVVVGGLPLRELRAMARREVIEAAHDSLSDFGVWNTPTGRPDGPLLVAGHQPELSHPGVWVKNFALNGSARKLGGTPLNLIVDNDTLKSASLRFPDHTGHGPVVGLESVPFDRVEAEVPYHDRHVLDPECFRTFPDRAAPLWRNWGYEPLLPRVWAGGGREPPVSVEAAAGSRPPPAVNVGEWFTTMRLERERAWGCENLELPVSLLFWCESYARFVAHLFDDLPRFAAVYNRSVRRYRRANRVRSKNHPVPELDIRQEDAEAPFWMTWYGQDRRTRFYVRRDGDQLRTTTGALISADINRFVREWPEFAESGTQITPRALTLTLFARVCLGDFFIHGIGGGKYDEVTDAIIRDYFGIDPPAYQVLSATLHLPLPGLPATDGDAKRADRLVRDLHWNPQRHLPEANFARPEVAELVRERERVVAAEPPAGDRAARREWFRRLQQLTERLRPYVFKQLAPAKANLVRSRVEAESNAVLRRRDYSWVLYPEETLRPFLQQFLTV